MQGEQRTAAGCTVELDESAMLLDDAADDAEPEASPAGFALGGEERLEDAPLELGSYARPVVLDGDAHEHAGLGSLRQHR